MPSQMVFASNAIVYAVNPPISNDLLNSLFEASWQDHRWTDFEPVLKHSLAYLCAYEQDRLIGFVYLAWDGGIHAFLLDPTVHPDFRRHGIGQRLVREAAEIAQARGIYWL